MRILVLDDEDDVLMMCRVNLEFEGHEVVAAAGGEEGILLAVETHPDVIILDLMLPRRDGYSVLEQLQEMESTRSIPVILLTARTGEEDQLRGWEGGAADYVTKPFSPAALHEAVAEIGRLSPAERAMRRRRHLDRLTVLRRL